MAPGFEQRRDAIHEGILRGDIGCPFASEAARSDEIVYCPAPRRIDPLRVHAGYIDSITNFALDTRKAVLIALPDSDEPRTEADCKAYAQQLFPETVSTMRYAIIHALDHLLAECRDGDDDLYQYQEMNPAADRGVIFDHWRRNGHQLTNSFPADSAMGPLLIRRKTRKLEPIFAFTMDPTYTPVRDLPHPRYSPHTALIVNYRRDLQGLKDTKPGLYEATKRWLSQAVGYSYGEGFRVDQKPEAEDPVKRAWKPQD